jgi:hypothetical protein
MESAPVIPADSMIRVVEEPFGGAAAPRVLHRPAAPSPNGADDRAGSDRETRSPSRRRQSIRDTSPAGSSAASRSTHQSQSAGARPRTDWDRPEDRDCGRRDERLLAEILRLGRVVHHSCRENRSLAMMATDQFVPGFSRLAPGFVHQLCDCARRHHTTVEGRHQNVASVPKRGDPGMARRPRTVAPRSVSRPVSMSSEAPCASRRLPRPHCAVSGRWWALLVGALRVDPHKHDANHPLQEDLCEANAPPRLQRVTCGLRRAAASLWHVRRARRFQTKPAAAQRSSQASRDRLRRSGQGSSWRVGELLCPFQDRVTSDGDVGEPSLNRDVWSDSDTFERSTVGKSIADRANGYAHAVSQVRPVGIPRASLSRFADYNGSPSVLERHDEVFARRSTKAVN